MQVSPVSSLPFSSDPTRAVERLNHMPAAQQRKVVAEQFEALFLRQLLAPALQSLPGAGNGIYNYMLTDAFAQKLSAGERGLGLSSMLERQFTPAGETAAANTSSTPSTDNTSSVLKFQ